MRQVPEDERRDLLPLWDRLAELIERHEILLPEKAAELSHEPARISGSGAVKSQLQSVCWPLSRMPALVAITLDLEMSRNFPTWETTHWDFEKGNLNDETKKYAAEAARRVKERGGRVHFFALGRTLEQENVDWLAQDRRGRAPDRQSHVRPRQRQGDQGRPTSSSASSARRGSLPDASRRK